MKWMRWHDAILEVVQDWEPGKLLDVPSSEGALPARLAEMGFDVVCADLDLSRLGCDLPAVALNLCDPMPFKTASFDYLTFVEGIEHLERPFLCLQELARVVKPGGRMILSTPNVLNLRSRWRFLTAGYHLRFREADPDGVGSKGHILPLTYREYRYLLRRAGFEVVRFTTDVRKRKLWPIHATLKLLNRIYARKHNPLADDVLRPELLEGRTLIIEARRLDDGGAAPNRFAARATQALRDKDPAAGQQERRVQS
jgi:SAM-dependent methyltransferase